MILRRSFSVCSLLLLAATAWPQKQAIPYHQTDFQPEEFKTRWAAVSDEIGNESVAVLQGAPQTNGFIFPSQTNDFYYLCGVETPQSNLLLDGRIKKVTLSSPVRNARLESAEGKVLSEDDVAELDDLEKLVGRGGLTKDMLKAGLN